MEHMSGSAIRAIFKYTARPGVISFGGGNPANFALPVEEVTEVAESLLRERGTALLQYGQTEGYPALREALPAYVQELFSVDLQQEEVMVTTGSMQGLDLLCKVLIDPGDVVLCESPAFLGAIQCLRSYEPRLIGVGMDDQGMRVDQLEALMKEHRPKLLYTIPTFQNPSGVTLSLERRREVARLAARYGVLVAEDDPYHALRYRGEDLPAIKAFDEEGWVVLMGSFSKVISPGLRVGFLAGDPELLRRCTICKQSTDVHTANLNQAIVDRFIRSGMIPPLVERILPGYTQRLDTMLGALSGMEGLARFTRPDGGLFIFARLAGGRDVTPIFHQAIERGVAFVPGTPFYPDGGNQDTLRLNFSNASPEEIRRGMAIIADCIKGTAQKED